MYSTSPDVFLTLLQIYLLSSSNVSTTAVSSPPTDPSSITLLRPALDLISRHSPRLDSVQVLNLLPPLVPAADVREFLLEALRVPRLQTRVFREIWKARKTDVEIELIGLQERRVKVTDVRM